MEAQFEPTSDPDSLPTELLLLPLLLLPLPPPPLTAAARWLPPSLREAELLAPTTSTQPAFLELKLGSVRGQMIKRPAFVMT